MQLAEPVEFVVFDDFDLIFLVDDVVRDLAEGQLEMLRVLADDAEKGNGSLDFGQAVALEERDPAPRPSEPVAKSAHERRDALFCRQPR